nr:LOW QUALITY PROTEIN: DNA repair protein XRCC1 [Aedes albopictus]
MPNVVFKSVESFSSEDPSFPAANLLGKDARKWKCRDAGEKNAFVVLRLEKPLTINGIDVGNEHSAFVEVLVARSGPTNPEYKEILLTSSFMTPIESRNSTNTNRVRCFTQDALIESVARGQWDLVKIICTQPFNSRVQYGLSFVTVHCPSAERKHERELIPAEKKSLVPDKFKKQIQEVAEKGEERKVTKLGRFTIREESPDSDEGNNSASLFARWKESRNGIAGTVSPKVTSSPSNVVSTAAAIRNASTPAAVKNRHSTPMASRKPVAITPKTKPRLFDDDDDDDEVAKKPLNRNRDSLLYDKDDDRPNEKLEKKMAEDRARAQREKDAKADKEKRDRALVEKKAKVHDTSASKFKDFLFDDPPNGIKDDSPKKISSSQEKPNRSRSPSAEKAKHKRHDSDKGDEKHQRDTKPSEERKKRPSESPAKRDRSKEEGSSSSKKPKLQQPSRNKDDEKDGSKRKPATYKPFNKLLENVVLVISGIQNPDRANLRNQALAMGAKYKSDWDSSCTHLICAFKNTPKYNQVHGKGKIVKKDWIERCHALRKRLSWRKFAMDSNDAEQTESEGEIIDISKKPSGSSPHKRGEERSRETREEPVRETDEEALAHYDLDDVVMVEDAKPDTVEVSGSDTEEEIERVKQMQQKKPTEDVSGMYDKSTEDEGSQSTADAFAPLDFFKGKSFFIDSDVGAVDIIKLERYVKLYKGSTTKTATEADYVVTRNRKPMGDSFKGEIIKPLWVYECHDMECLIPTQRYRP